MKISKYIDHTILKPDATNEDIERVCKEAIENDFYSVCVNPYYVPKVSRLLRDSEVGVTSVIGFPLGASITEVKAFEAQCSVRDGANEIDMVINVAALKNKEFDYVENDIRAVVQASKPNASVKVILETCLLTDEEKVKACELSKSAGADFVKTSTGFSTGGATVSDIKLMRKVVGDKMGVKASGGIRTKDDVTKAIEAGANRIGASSSVAIVNDCLTDNDGY